MFRFQHSNAKFAIFQFRFDVLILSLIFFSNIILCYDGQFLIDFFFFFAKIALFSQRLVFQVLLVSEFLQLFQIALFPYILKLIFIIFFYGMFSFAICSSQRLICSVCLWIVSLFF